MTVVNPIYLVGMPISKENELSQNWDQFTSLIRRAKYENWPIFIDVGFGYYQDLTPDGADFLIREGMKLIDISQLRPNSGVIVDSIRMFYERLKILLIELNTPCLYLRPGDPTVLDWISEKIQNDFCERSIVLKVRSALEIIKDQFIQMNNLETSTLFEYTDSKLFYDGINLIDKNQNKIYVIGCLHEKYYGFWYLPGILMKLIHSGFGSSLAQLSYSDGRVVQGQVQEMIAQLPNLQSNKHSTLVFQIQPTFKFNANFDDKYLDSIQDSLERS